MGSLLPSNTFGGKGIEMFLPVGGAEPDFDVIVQGDLTVSGQEVLLPTANLTMTSGTIMGNDAEFRGPVSCTNFTAEGLITGERATITGELQCGSILTDGGLEITELFADSAAVIGPITCGNLVTGNGVTVNGAAGATINGPLTTTGPVNFNTATVTAGAFTSTGALTAASGFISGNLTVNGALLVPGGIDPPPVVPGFQCSSIAFGSLLIVFGFGSTGFDGSVTYTCPPFLSVYSISATGNSGVNCLYARNTENPAAGTIRCVATSVGGTPTGAGVGINMVAFLRRA